MRECKLMNAFSSRVIDIDGYGVDLDGSGRVSVSGSDELNYRGLAEITDIEKIS
jgi:hypothetical protein